MVEQVPEERGVAVRIIVDEVTRCLDADPAFRGRPRPWLHRVREWPGKVVPESPEQVHAAVLTLISRTLWPHTEVRPLITKLTPLYRGGWCNDAVVRAMDTNPDGSHPGQPWRDNKERGDLIAYVDRRLRRWRGADPDSLANNSTDVPPSPVADAVSFGAWAARMHAVYGDRERDRGVPARASDVEKARAAYARAHRHRGTGLDRHRDRVARRADRDRTLTALGAPAPVDPFIDPDDDLVLLADPEVHAAVRALLAAAHPGRRHQAALRLALRAARLSQLASNPVTTGRVTAAQVGALADRVTHADGSTVEHHVLRRLLREAW